MPIGNSYCTHEIRCVILQLHNKTASCGNAARNNSTRAVATTPDPCRSPNAERTQHRIPEPHVCFGSVRDSKIKVAPPDNGARPAAAGLKKGGPPWATGRGAHSAPHARNNHWEFPVSAHRKCPMAHAQRRKPAPARGCRWLGIAVMSGMCGVLWRCPVRFICLI